MTITINGSGSITGLSAGGLPDATVQQADLAANVAGNGPAFMAYQSTLQSLANATVTPVVFQTEEYDTNGNFASSAFTPTVPGFYQLSFCVRLANSPVDLQLVIRKNGVSHRFIGRTTATLMAASCLEYANGTDVFDIAVYQSSGAAMNTVVGRDTFFSGFLARAA